MKLIKQLGIRSSQLLVICALCIYVIFSMTGMSVHKDRLRKVLMQESSQSKMAVPLVEGNPVVNGSLYRHDVGLPHELQPTEPLNMKERSASLLPPSGDIYLGKQSLGALARPDDMWVLEEPPNSTEPLSHVKLDELPLITDAFTEPSVGIIFRSYPRLKSSINHIMKSNHCRIDCKKKTRFSTSYDSVTRWMTCPILRVVPI